MSLSMRQRGKKKVWYVRGTVDGKRFRERSTGTADKRLADRRRAKWENEAYDRSVNKRIGFDEALIRYLDAGGEERFTPAILTQFSGWDIEDIHQLDIDGAAVTLYPDATTATRNRQVYTPMAAILHRAGREIRLNRPKIEKRKARDVPDAEWFSKMLPHCSEQLAALILFMAATGARISESLSVRLNLPHMEAEMDTKTGPRLVRMPTYLVAVLANMKKEPTYPFGYRYRHSVYPDLKKACAAAKVRYFSTHEFGRHYLATSLLRKGYSLKHVQDMGGWESIRLVAEVYGHLERDDFGDVRGEILADFGQQVGKRTGKV